MSSEKPSEHVGMVYLILAFIGAFMISNTILLIYFSWTLDDGPGTGLFPIAAGILLFRYFIIASCFFLLLELIKYNSYPLMKTITQWTNKAPVQVLFLFLIALSSYVITLISDNTSMDSPFVLGPSISIFFCLLLYRKELF